MVGQVPAFVTYNVETLSAPVLLSVPHAGRDYPTEMLADLRLPLSDLVRLEDRYADRLLQSPLSAGFPAIVARRARAWIDLNRAETDFDAQMVSGFDKARPAVPSAKTRGGLGLVPRRLQAVGELWKRPLTEGALEARLQDAHRPYHQTIRQTLRAMRDRFGTAILLDIHSMPPVQPRFSPGQAAERPPQVVIGDRFGRSAASIFAEIALAHFRQNGVPAALNSPYPGDFILQAHGNPGANIHALQIEVDRSLYLDSALREPIARMAEISSLVAALAALLADHICGISLPEAAE